MDKLNTDLIKKYVGRYLRDSYESKENLIEDVTVAILDLVNEIEDLEMELE